MLRGKSVSSRGVRYKSKYCQEKRVGRASASMEGNRLKKESRKKKKSGKSKRKRSARSLTPDSDDLSGRRSGTPKMVRTPSPRRNHRGKNKKRAYSVSPVPAKFMKKGKRGNSTLSLTPS